MKTRKSTITEIPSASAAESAPRNAGGIDEATVARIAHLARIKVTTEETVTFKRELNGILGWVAELNAIPTDGVDAIVSFGASLTPMRHDIVTDGDKVRDILKNAPKSEDNFFLVPKVIE